ncbi:MAG: hypothetical protein HZB29_02755 [Nitrospinae bacterium]|nr:hypothetical protein [Nitrospinota bacterium]
MWSERPFAAAALILAVTASSAFADAEAGLRALYQRETGGVDNVFHAPPGRRAYPSEEARQDAYLRWSGPLGKFSGVATSAEGVDCCGSNQKGTVNELYANLTIAEGVEASVGKKVASWGMGQGFRPLDVIQREDRQAIEPLDLEGIPMVTIESFSGVSGITLIVGDRSWMDGSGVEKDELEAGLKYSSLLGSADLQIVAHALERKEASAGAGLSIVSGDSFEAHASFNYLPYYTKQFHTLAGQPAGLLETHDPYVDVIKHHGAQALIGGSWTWENAVSLMIEAWHDDTAYTKSEWEDILDIAQSQSSLLEAGVPEEAVYGNINGASRIFKRRNILQDAVMVRLAYGGKDFRPEIYALATPADGGLAVTAAADYRLRDGIIMFGAVRWLGGNRDSAYAQAGFSEIIYAGIRVEGALIDEN